MPKECVSLMPPAFLAPETHLDVLLWPPLSLSSGLEDSTLEAVTLVMPWVEFAPFQELRVMM